MNNNNTTKPGMGLSGERKTMREERRGRLMFVLVGKKEAGQFNWKTFL